MSSSYSASMRRSSTIAQGNALERALGTALQYTLRALCLSHLLGEGLVAIGPYVRFVWIMSLGVMDFFLVLVLLFWPEKDFMCKRAGGVSSRVIEEEDIVATIGAILCLHFGDVVSPLAWTLPLSCRPHWLRVFHRDRCHECASRMKLGGRSPSGKLAGKCNSRRLSYFVCGRRIGLRFFSPHSVGGRGAALFNMWDCFIVLISVRDDDSKDISAKLIT